MTVTLMTGQNVALTENKDVTIFRLKKGIAYEAITSGKVACSPPL
jgi:hypothetical protein